MLFRIKIQFAYLALNIFKRDSAQSHRLFLCEVGWLKRLGLLYEPQA